MTTTTYEEAKQCPKCGKPGEVTRKTPTRNTVGQKCELHLIYCRTQLCPWYNTPWTVQVNEDGSIPQPYSSLEKQFPLASPESETRIQEAIESQLQAETRPGGGEVRNPNSGR